MRNIMKKHGHDVKSCSAAFNSNMVYVVVCTDLHYAYGPYVSPVDAVYIAKILNEQQGGCSYLPVPLIVDERYSSFSIIQGPSPSSTPSTPRREEGYL